MGLEPFNVASALNLVLAQRLVRRVCPQCRVKYTPDDSELAGAKVTRNTSLGDLRFTQEALDNARARAMPDAAPHLEALSLETTIGQLPYFKGKGCDTCAGTGLKGRQGLYEVMTMRARTLQDVSDLDIGSALTHLPLTDLPQQLGCGQVPFWDRWIAHPTLDAYWRAHAVTTNIANVKAPVLQISGWYDDSRGPIDYTNALNKVSGHPFVRLVMKRPICPSRVRWPSG